MPSAAHDDAELVRASRTGDAEAFGRLVERHKHLVFAVCLAALRDRARAEEVAQDAFFAAWCSLDRLRDEHKLRPWLCGIARNVAGKTMRRNHREDAAIDVPEVGDDRNPLDELVERETEQLVWKALDAVPDAYREPLLLFYQHEQPIRDVAAALGLSDDAVKQRLSRGRKLLRDRIPIETFAGVARRAVPTGAFTAAVLASISAAPKVAQAAAAVAQSSATPGVIAMSTATKLVIAGAVVAATAGGIAWSQAGQPDRPGPTTTAAREPGGASQGGGAPASSREAEQQEIQRLRRKVHALEEELSHVRRRGAPGTFRSDEADVEEDKDDAPEMYFDSSEAELYELAKTCTLRYDQPRLSADARPVAPAELLDELGVGDATRAEITRVQDEFRTEFAAKLRTLYVEATGDTAGADNLSAETMAGELENKTVPEDVRATHWRLTQERGGLLDPPDNLEETPPFERWLRLQLQLGDILQQRLAAAIGEDMAYELRAHGGGFGGKSQWGGSCGYKPSLAK